MALAPPTSVSRGYPLALTGATAATRYVGATSSGAPASGTFAVGDYVVTQNGGIYICTAAGSPGTWAAIGAGGAGTELAYVEFTSSVTITSTNDAAPNDVVSAGAVTFDGSRVCVECFAPCVDAFGNDTGCVSSLYQDASRVGFIGQIGYAAAALDFRGLFYARRYLTPAAGSKTFKWAAWKGGGTAVIIAGSAGSGDYMPGFIRITKV